MAKDKESYWSRHHTGVIQCVLALYCSVLGTLEYINTRSAAHASFTLQPSGGVPMTHGYSMPLYLWLGIIALCLSVAVPAVLRLRKSPKTEESKLVIHSAVYGVDGKKDVDVKEALSSKIRGDALVLWIENGEFGDDPVDGIEKRLMVRYSFAGHRVVQIERQEHDFMVLPEDSRLKSSVQVVQLVQEVPNPVDGLLAPLQIEAFAIAKELRAFNAFLGPYPREAVPNNEGVLAPDMNRYNKEISAWEHKLSHGYANRDFGRKAASIFNLAGEKYDLEYPPDMLSRSAEIGPSFTSWGITKLAQEMEMIAIWINRKQRNEEDILS